MLDERKIIQSPVKWTKMGLTVNNFYEGMIDPYVVYMWNNPTEMLVFSEFRPNESKIKFRFRIK